MKKKELKSLATRIAAAEQIIAKNEDAEAVRKAKNTVMELTERLDGMDDLLAVDEMVQEIISKNS